MQKDCVEGFIPLGLGGWQTYLNDPQIVSIFCILVRDLVSILLSLFMIECWFGISFAIDIRDFLLLIAYCFVYLSALSSKEYIGLNICSDD